MAFASGSAVSAGVLTLAAGQNFYIGYGSAAAINVLAHAESAVSLALNEWDGSALGKKKIARMVAGVTGSATSLTIPASIADADYAGENTSVAWVALFAISVPTPRRATALFFGSANAMDTPTPD